MVCLHPSSLPTAALPFPGDQGVPRTPHLHLQAALWACLPILNAPETCGPGDRRQGSCDIEAVCSQELTQGPGQLCTACAGTLAGSTGAGS